MKAESMWETHQAVSSSHFTLIKLEFSQNTTFTKTLPKSMEVQSTPSQRWHLWKSTAASVTNLPWLRRTLTPGNPPAPRCAWALVAFQTTDEASPLPVSWRLPDQWGMAADLKDTLLKRLSHVSADHVFSLSTLQVQIPLYNRSQTEKALCIK